jgi:hypothetical protein
MIAVQDQPAPRRSPGAAVRVLGVVWGIGGIAAVLVYAAFKLGRYAVEAVASGLDPGEWLGLLASATFMAWAEGYRGFQQRFSPRVAARALDLYLRPTARRLWLAPLFCTGYFGATSRLRWTVWIGTGLIVLAVLLFSRFSQPWRGILDAGVMVGLIWGTVSLLVAAVSTFRQHRPLVPSEVPSEVPPAMYEGAAL